MKIPMTTQSETKTILDTFYFEYKKMPKLNDNTTKIFKIT